MDQTHNFCMNYRDKILDKKIQRQCQCEFGKGNVRDLFAYGTISLRNILFNKPLKNCSDIINNYHNDYIIYGIIIRFTVY